LTIGGVGNGNLTKATLFPGGGASPRVVQNAYDWRNRLVATKSGATGTLTTEDPSVDLPPLNGTTPRERIWWCQNQRRAFNSTRKERTGRADHPQATSVEVEVGRGKTVAEAVKKIGVMEQTYSRWKKQYGGLRIDQAKRLKDLDLKNDRSIGG
jgi:hypothetical protein